MRISVSDYFISAAKLQCDEAWGFNPRIRWIIGEKRAEGARCGMYFYRCNNSVTTWRHHYANDKIYFWKPVILPHSFRVRNLHMETISWG